MLLYLTIHVALFLVRPLIFVLAVAKVRELIQSGFLFDSGKTRIREGELPPILILPPAEPVRDTEVVV